MSKSATDIELRPITASDESAIVEFTSKLPEADLLFTRRKLTEPKVIKAWLAEIESGEIYSEAALRSGEIVGYNALITQPHSWSSHVGEIRVMIGPDGRRHGIGRMLAEAAYKKALEIGLAKVTASMTADQHGAIALFEGMGFRPEALLRNQVQTAAGDKYDLAVFSQEVGEAQMRRSVLGMGG